MYNFSLSQLFWHVIFVIEFNLKGLLLFVMCNYLTLVFNFTGWEEISCCTKSPRGLAEECWQFVLQAETEGASNSEEKDPSINGFIYSHKFYALKHCIKIRGP